MHRSRAVQILWLVSFHLHFTKSHATSKPVGTCGGSLAPNCRVEEGGAENAVGVLRVKINGGGRLLVLYQYYEAPKAAENLRYFLAKSILEPAQRRQRTGGEKDDALAEGVDYVFVISGHVCSVALPEGPQYPQVQVLRIDNQHICLGGWSKALRLLGLWAGVEEADEGRATGEAAGGNEEEGGTLPAKYGAFVFINSSCRGPFLPKYVSGFLHWATPFLSRLNQKVKLVGASLHFIPSYSTEAAFCNVSRSPLWADVTATGAGPRVDGYMFVTDRVGLMLLQRAGVFRSFDGDKRAAVNLGEYAISRTILEAGYGLTSLNSEWMDLDLTDVRNWPGPQGFIQGERKKKSAGGIAEETAVTSAVTSAVNHVSAVTVNQGRALWREKPGIVYAPQPMEVIFIKTLWGETEGESSVDFEHMDEELALMLGSLTENVYSRTLLRPQVD